MKRDMRPCKRCKGSGYVPLSNSKASLVCQTCRGRGKVEVGVRPRDMR